MGKIARWPAKHTDYTTRQLSVYLNKPLTLEALDYNIRQQGDIPLPGKAQVLRPSTVAMTS